jgi:hypothetical protein
VIGTHNRAFEKAPHPLRNVNVDIALYSLLCVVVDSFMAGSVVGGALADRPIIGDDRLRLMGGGA